MLKIQFATLAEALDHAKRLGGWLFQSKDNNTIIWYNAAHYTMSMILKDTPESGYIATWKEIEERLNYNIA